MVYHLLPNIGLEGEGSACQRTWVGEPVSMTSATPVKVRDSSTECEDIVMRETAREINQPGDDAWRVAAWPVSYQARAQFALCRIE